MKKYCKNCKYYSGHFFHCCKYIIQKEELNEFNNCLKTRQIKNNLSENDEGNCRYYKRIWWYFGVAK